ncbi:MAG: glycosyltransferase family 4 protein [Anaerolineae bacterium]|nr:glycosyltransferase family 4 protein [Anaerolineae bacterium]
MKPLRILTISNCPLVASQGSGYIITNFCKGLRQLGHEVDLFGPRDYEPLQAAQGRAKSYRQSLGLVPFTLNQLRRNSYDIVEFYGAEAWLIMTILSAIPNRNFLIVSHSNGLETQMTEVMTQYRTILKESRKWYQFDQSRVFIRAFTQADGLVLVSHNDGKYALRHQYATPHRLQVIENALPDSYLGLEVSFQRPKVIGFCGSWLPLKGIALMQEVLPKLLREFPEWSIKLIGVGKTFREETIFPPTLCERIEVIPFVNDKAKLRQIYESLAILIAPSVYESFGLVTTEAMACGCAVVGNKTGYMAHLIPREQVMIMENYSSSSLYQALRELIQDESLRQKIACRGYERVQSLKWSSSIECLENTYQRWLTEFRNHQQR